MWSVRIEYAVKAIWLIWLIAWSGRLMATISMHGIAMGMGAMFGNPLQRIAVVVVATSHSIGLIKVLCVHTWIEYMATFLMSYVYLHIIYGLQYLKRLLFAMLLSLALVYFFFVFPLFCVFPFILISEYPKFCSSLHILSVHAFPFTFMQCIYY